MRKLASIQTIREIVPIEGADRIELARINGWQSVVPKGMHTVGERVVYCEIDCWIPHSLAPHLSKGSEPKVYDGINGNRLRTVTLKGVLSQGLVLPASVLFDRHVSISCLNDDEDVSSILGIVKYDPPVPAHLQGQIKSTFPSHTPKTDQQRVQTLGKQIEDYHTEELTFEITEKLEGSSMTVCVNSGEIDVCSRTMSLKDDGQNTFWKVANQYNLIEKLQSLNRNLSFQFELCGEGIQKNIYKIKGHKCFLYDIYDIDRGRYLLPEERVLIANELQINHVPVIGYITFSSCNVHNIDKILSIAEGKSVLNTSHEREGIVFKCMTENISFKAISNKYLLQES